MKLNNKYSLALSAVLPKKYPFIVSVSTKIESGHKIWIVLNCDYKKLLEFFYENKLDVFDPTKFLIDRDETTLSHVFMFNMEYYTDISLIIKNILSMIPPKILISGIKVKRVYE